MGRVWAGFLYIRTRPASQDSRPRPASIINRIFFGAQTRSIWPRPKIIHLEIRTIPKSQITEYICNFLGNHSIFLPSKRMPRSNKPICTINPTNRINFCKPRNKLIKYENLSNETPKKNPTNLAHKKKPKPRFCSQNHEKRKTQTQILLTKTQKEPSNQVL